MAFAILYHVVLAALVIGFIEGSEIAMLIVAAASRYKWRKAWMTASAALATLVPLIAILYLFFTALPQNVTILLSGTVILLLGAHFFYEGIQGRNEKEPIKDEAKAEIGIGLVGVYAAILMEEVEAGGISISIGAAAGGAYLSAILGMLIGIAIPIVATKRLEPIIERLPEWLVQMALGAVMMGAAALILIYHL